MGLGTLSLSGANTYSGITTVGAGILEANAAAALGALTAGTVVDECRWTLDVGESAVLGELLTLNGSGFGTLPQGGVAGLLTPRGAARTSPAAGSGHGQHHLEHEQRSYRCLRRRRHH